AGLGRCALRRRGLGRGRVRLARGAIARVPRAGVGPPREIEMMHTLLVSNALLWVLVVALAGIVAALARQVGVLHERLAPLGALAPASGPVPGEAAPELVMSALSGAEVRIGGADPGGRSTLLFFASPSCPICKTLLPTVRRAVAAEDRVRLVCASDGESAEHAAFAREQGLDPASYVVSRELGVRYEVAKLPY